MFFKGFTGIGKITRTGHSPSPVYFRFVNADVALTQGVNFFLPSYGNSDDHENLRRIVAPTTGDVAGRISLILAENMADIWYQLAYTAEEFLLELYFGNKRKRSFANTKIESLTFDCRGGELVSVNFDTVSKSYVQEESDISYISTFGKYNQKLVDWTKVGMDGFKPSIDILSFSYTIKNNLLSIKTAQSLLPSHINRAIQEVSGNITLVDVMLPDYATDPYEIKVNEITFRVEDVLSVTHDIVNHWSYRTPLSADMIMTTLDWTRVDKVQQSVPTP